MGDYWLQRESDAYLLMKQRIPADRLLVERKTTEYRFTFLQNSKVLLLVVLENAGCLCEEFSFAIASKGDADSILEWLSELFEDKTVSIETAPWLRAMVRSLPE